MLSESIQAIKIGLLIVSRKIERAYKRIHRPIIMRRLRRVNLYSKHAITSPEGPIVTLTSFDQRIDIVFYTIESIGAGTILPSSITLWLEHDLIQKGLPESLKRLQKRGLSIQGIDDLGPHKKYYPEISNPQHIDKIFITIDDDTLYPKYCLQKILNSYESMPNAIHCFRAHRIRLSEDGSLAPYSTWKPCLSKKASHLHFSTGSCAVLFPASIRMPLQDLGLSFQKYCPRADDIWLNSVALKNNIPVKQVVSVPKLFYEVPGTRSNALALHNNGNGGNDAQLEASYTSDALARLTSLSKEY